MKNQALFSSNDKTKKIKCLLQFLFGALRVKGTAEIFPQALLHYIPSSTVHKFDRQYPSISHSFAAF